MTVRSTVRVCCLVRDCQLSAFPASSAKISWFPALSPASGSATGVIRVLTQVYTDISQSLLLPFLVLTQECFHIFLFDVCVFFSEASVKCLWPIFPSGNNLLLRIRGSLHLVDISCLLEVLLRNISLPLVALHLAVLTVLQRRNFCFCSLTVKVESWALELSKDSTAEAHPIPKHFTFDYAKLGSYFINFDAMSKETLLDPRLSNVPVSFSKSSAF